MFTGLSGSGSGSPLQARATAPVFLFIIILLSIAAFLGIIFLISTQITKYRKSERYIKKAQKSPTKRKDVVELGRSLNFTSAEINLLWKVCFTVKFPNILYNLKSTEDVDNLFRNAYQILKQQDYFSDERLDLFFSILYRLELMVAQRKTISSTRQIQLNKTVTYIATNGEQQPLTVVENTRESMTLEIPDYIHSTKEKPQPLAKSRFTYKTDEGLSYNYIARVIRYTNTEKEGEKHYLMIVSHSEQLESQAQRHFKREFTEESCTFCSLRFAEDKKSGQLNYIYSNKLYKGKLANISAGGCCIHTHLPVKEKQNLSVSIAGYDIWKIPGIIRKTRRLPGGKFALHVQFTKVRLADKNKIQAIIYKYDL
ncbi:MAG: PilZ domain-containing protein [Treponema sp.]|nr:PilZ domain-containing protein [Treponema sp.]